MNLATITNFLTRSFFIFVIAFLWVSFYVRDFIVQFLISSIITVIANYLISFLLSKRLKRKITTREHLQHMQKTILQLKFMTPTEVQKLFRAALADKENIKIHSLFHKTPTEEDIIKIIKKNKSTDTTSKIYIAAETFTPQLLLFTRTLNLNIVLLNGEQVYNQILNPKQIYPKTIIEPNKKAKVTMRELREMMFARNKTKPYIITAMIILVTSFIVSFSIYYIIVATLIFGMSLASHLSPFGRQKNLFD